MAMAATAATPTIAHKATQGTSNSSLPTGTMMTPTGLGPPAALNGVPVKSVRLGVVSFLILAHM